MLGAECRDKGLSPYDITLEFKHTEIKRDRDRDWHQDREEWVYVYCIEHFTPQLMCEPP